MNNIKMNNKSKKVYDKIINTKFNSIDNFSSQSEYICTLNDYHYFKNSDPNISSNTLKLFKDMEIFGEIKALSQIKFFNINLLKKYENKDKIIKAFVKNSDFLKTINNLKIPFDSLDNYELNKNDILSYLKKICKHDNYRLTLIDSKNKQYISIAKVKNISSKSSNDFIYNDLRKNLLRN